jgi:hypothetical protein
MCGLTPALGGLPIAAGAHQASGSIMALNGAAPKMPSDAFIRLFFADRNYFF